MPVWFKANIDNIGLKLKVIYLVMLYIWYIYQSFSCIMIIFILLTINLLGLILHEVKKLPTEVRYNYI